MFDHFVWSVVVVPPLVVLVVRLLADRLPPATAARAVAWSAAVVAAASTVNLLLFAMKAVAQVPAVGRAFGWSARVVTADTAAEPWVPWLSVVLLVGVAVSVTRRWRRHRASWHSPGRAADGPLVVLDDPTARAFAVPGRPGYVVVTTGMRSLLTDRQFDALLAHERAHLAGRHHRLARLAGLAAAAHPALWWVARHVDYLVERAADEQAASRGRQPAHRRARHRRRGPGDRRNRRVGGRVGPVGAARRDAPGHRAAAGVAAADPRSWRGAGLLRLLPAALAAFSCVWSVEAAVDLVELIQAARGGR